MLFMGQEWAASAPFLLFEDHGPDLAPKVFDGRRDFLTQFPSLTVPSAMAAAADPSDPATFEQCRLDHAEADQPGHAEWLTLHRDLLALRRSTPVFARPRRGGSMARSSASRPSSSGTSTTATRGARRPGGGCSS